MATVFRIGITADPTGALRGTQAVTSALARAETAARNFGRTASGAFNFLGVGIGVRELLRTADAYTNLQNRLRTVISDEEKLIQTQRELLAISNDTRTSFKDNVELFQRFASATKSLGVSQQQLLGLTKSISQAIVLSGASSIEATNALRQLTQGLGTGALKGDELRSVLEQLPTVADVIAKQLGVTRGQLKKLGEEGKITTQVIVDAFENAASEIDANFKKTIPTVSQALQVLSNQFLSVFGETAKTSGAVAKLSQSLIFLAENMEKIVQVGLSLAAVFGASILGKAFRFLTSRTGVLAAAVVVATDQWSEFFRRTSEASVNFAAWTKEADALAFNLERTSKVLKGLNQDDMNRLGLIINNQGAVRINRGKDQTQLRIGRSLQTPDGIPTPKMIEDLANAAQGRVKTLNPLVKALTGATKSALQGVAEGLNGVKDAATGIDEAFERVLAVSGVFNELRNEAEILRLIIEDEEELVELKEIENQLRAEGIALTEAEKARLQTQIQANQQLRVQAEIMEGLLGPQQRLAVEMEAIVALYNQGKISAEQYGIAATQANIKALESSMALEDGLSRAFLKLSLEARDFASVAEAAVNSFADNATEALVNFAETGKFSIKEFARSVVSDLVRIIARLLVVQALTAVIGGGPAPPIAASQMPFDLPARAGGGPVMAGRSYLVGEEGPELVTPKSSGNVLPASATAAALAPNVNLQVVNVDDPNMVPQAVDSGRADQSFINLIARNATRINQTLGR